MDVNDKEALNKYISEIRNKEIIKKYIFVKNMSKRYEEEYLNTMYKIDSEKIKNMYEQIDEKERVRLEKTIMEQIAAGEIDLYEEALKWHKEGLRRAHKKDVYKTDKNGEGDER